MREILYRGKRVDNGEWVEGYYTQFVEFGDNGGVECYYREYEIVTDFIIEKNGTQHLINFKTIGQYTERKAEGNVKIFEGDNCILTTFDHNGHDTQHECTVRSIDGTLLFVDEKNDMVWAMFQIADTESDVIVIGNLHDGNKI